MKLLVGIPAYNEERTITKTLERVMSTSWPVRVIVCDGNSSDNTRSIALQKKAEVLYTPSYGDSIQTAFREASNEDYVIILDCESHNALEMYDALSEMKDKKIHHYLVAGYRDRYTATRIRKLITLLARWYIHRLFTVETIDITSGFRAYPISFVKNVRDNNALFAAPNYVINVNLALEAHRLGYNTYNFIMTYTGGQSALTLKKFVKSLWWGLKLLRKRV
jgi:glycosyltransferase involved in cell wall biosynthesis